MQVVKKLRKNKTVDTIADELEEEPEVIRRICLTAEACAPEYDVDEIYAVVLLSSATSFSSICTLSTR